LLFFFSSSPTHSFLFHTVPHHHEEPRISGNGRAEKRRTKKKNTIEKYLFAKGEKRGHRNPFAHGRRKKQRRKQQRHYRTTQLFLPNEEKNYSHDILSKASFRRREQKKRNKENSQGTQTDSFIWFSLLVVSFFSLPRSAEKCISFQCVCIYPGRDFFFFKTNQTKTKMRNNEGTREKNNRKQREQKKIRRKMLFRVLVCERAFFN